MVDPVCFYEKPHDTYKPKTLQNFKTLMMLVLHTAHVHRKCDFGQHDFKVS